MKEHSTHGKGNYQERFIAGKGKTGVADYEDPSWESW